MRVTGLNFSYKVDFDKKPKNTLKTQETSSLSPKNTNLNKDIKDT